MRSTLADIRREKLKRQAANRREWDPIAALQSNPQQIPIFLDTRRNRVVKGTRQGGKTRIALTDIIEAHRHCDSGGVSAYVDMDKEHGGKVAWEELRLMMTQFRIPAKIVDEELRFDNGSKLWIFSGEQSESKKLQSLKYVRLVVDEAQEHSKLSDIITMATPALMRHNGRAMYMGIPGRVSGVGDWWDICEGKSASEFGQHWITFWDNPYLSQEAKVELYESEKKRLGEKHPDFLRHWCGIWPVTNDELRIIHYDPDKHGYDGDAPKCNSYSLGLDPGGVKDAEAIVVLGHGNDDGVCYAVDEDETEKAEGGDWDDSGDRVGPINDRWHCHIRYYDYGSANKSALTLIYRKTEQILMTAVPSKDPYLESKRINQDLQAGRLKIKRGSKLEKACLYAEWDEDSLANGGTPKQSRKFKQNLIDALRCSMWATWNHKERVKVIKPVLTDEQREALRISRGDAYARKGSQSRLDKYSVPVLASKFVRESPTLRKPPQTNTNGRVNRGY